MSWYFLAPDIISSFYHHIFPLPQNLWSLADNQIVCDVFVTAYIDKGMGCSTKKKGKIGTNDRHLSKECIKPISNLPKTETI